MEEGTMVPQCGNFLQEYYYNIDHSLGDDQQISFEGDDGDTMWREKTSSYGVLEELILETMKPSQYSIFLFHELDYGKDRVSKVGYGGFIGGKLELQQL